MTHASLSLMLNAPRWSIDQTEADMLAGGISNVTRHYDVPGVSQITLDWIGLIQAVGTIYGTRLMAARADDKKAREQRRAAQAAQPQAQAQQPINTGGVSTPLTVPTADPPAMNAVHGVNFSQMEIPPGKRN